MALIRPATADDEIKPKNFPDCTKYTLKDGRTICGYVDLEEWKQVLKADDDLTEARSLLGLERDKVKALELKGSSLQGQVEACEKIAGLQKQRNEDLTKDLLETNRKYENERVKPKWGNPLAWATAGLAAAVLGGFLLNDVI